MKILTQKSYIYLRSYFIAISLVLLIHAFAIGQSEIDLAGQWFVELEPVSQRSADFGHSPDAEGRLPVRLPGALRDSDIGNVIGPNTQWIGEQRPELLKRPEFAAFQESGNYKCPFWLQPNLHYVGTAKYQRDVTIPSNWEGERIILHLERPHWRTTVFVDGQKVGENDSLSVPHEYDLTKHLSAGPHRLIVHVDNSLDTLDVGYNSHSVSDHTQTAWNGIVGKIALYTKPMLSLENISVYPASDASSAEVSFNLNDFASQAERQVRVHCEVWQHDQKLGASYVDRATATPSQPNVCKVMFDRPADRWDEFHPNLCRLITRIEAKGASGFASERHFGVRHLTTRGTQFFLNGRPTFFRGALDCCIFPLTGYPPTDAESWRRIVRVCKSYGLNHLRFHSWCPPEAAFTAADELGFYFQVECSSWPNQSTSVGDDRAVDAWLYSEGQRVLSEYGSHPSFMLFAMGNEPGGPENGAKYLREWVAHFKPIAINQLVTGGSGWPSIAESAFHVTPLPRIQQWGEGLNSRINALPPATVADYRDFIGNFPVPVISHEIGQWCVYPNLEEISKYTGALKARNFEIFETLLRQRGLREQANKFFMASGKLQALTYKEEIESALRTPGFGGFQLLGLQDFSGQGTALVGVVDPFWDAKPYVSSEEFRRFCGPTVPLARMAKRILTNADVFSVQIELSHFGSSTLDHLAATWRILDGERTFATGTFPEKTVQSGTLVDLGSIDINLSSVACATKLTLEVDASDAGQEAKNTWDFWVYPSHQVETAMPTDLTDVFVASELNEAAIKKLNQGGKVLLLASPLSVDSKIRTGFSPIFWSSAWTGGQAPDTLGILCDPKHAALSDFPTDFHSDWQWWEVISRSRPMVLDELNPAVQPVVQIVPDWFDPRKLALVFEAKVGNGKLLVCSVDLTSDLAERPAARQLLHSLRQYVASDAFEPSAEVDFASLAKLFLKH